MKPDDPTLAELRISAIVAGCMLAFVTFGALIVTMLIK